MSQDDMERFIETFIAYYRMLPEGAARDGAVQSALMAAWEKGAAASTPPKWETAPVRVPLAPPPFPPPTSTVAPIWSPDGRMGVGPGALSYGAVEEMPVFRDTHIAKDVVLQGPEPGNNVFAGGIFDEANLSLPGLRAPSEDQLFGVAEQSREGEFDVVQIRSQIASFEGDAPNLGS